MRTTRLAPDHAGSVHTARHEPRRRPAARFGGAALTTRRRRVFTCAVGLFAGSVSQATAQQGFHGIGHLQGGTNASRAVGVSGNGQVVVGVGTSERGKEALRWTLASGLVALGDFETKTYPFDSWAFDASFDGSVVVGFCRNEHRVQAACAFTQNGGGSWQASLLAARTCNEDISEARGVTDDGHYYVGSTSWYCTSMNYVLFGGVGGPWEDGSACAGGQSGCRLNGMTPDGIGVGSTVYSKASKHQIAALCRGFSLGVPDWEILDDLPGGTTESVAFAGSRGAKTVVGRGSAGEGNLAFRWSATTGQIESLGDLFGGPVESEARATDDANLTVVGYGSIEAGARRAFVWKAGRGILDLKSWLGDRGISVGAWVLEVATGISNDGRTIVGRGLNPSGQEEGWVVFLPARCNADLNDSGEIDPDDNTLFWYLYGEEDPAADLNDDFVVDFNDALVWLSWYTGSC